MYTLLDSTCRRVHPFWGGGGTVLESRSSRHYFSSFQFSGPITVAEYMRTSLTHPAHVSTSVISLNICRALSAWGQILNCIVDSISAHDYHVLRVTTCNEMYLVPKETSSHHQRSVRCLERLVTRIIFAYRHNLYHSNSMT